MFCHGAPNGKTHSTLGTTVYLDLVFLHLPTVYGDGQIYAVG